MTDAFAARRAAFRDLHREGCFVLPNPWDLGSVRRLERAGFPALASTSAGAAWALGRGNGDLSRDEVLDHLRALVAMTDLPVNADFEAGFADAPEAVAANAGLAAGTGVAALSIEDRVGRDLYDDGLAVERIHAARAALPADVMLVARTEAFLVGRTEVRPAIDRLVAFAEVGADVLYAPGITRLEDLAALVRAVAPRPVNALLWGDAFTVAQAAEAGVRRLSTGAALAHAAWTGFDAAVAQLAKR